MSRKLDFQVGFTNKSHKMWINDDRDICDALECYKQENLLCGALVWDQRLQKSIHVKMIAKVRLVIRRKPQREMLVIQRRKKTASE